MEEKMSRAEKVWKDMTDLAETTYITAMVVAFCLLAWFLMPYHILRSLLWD